MNHKQRKYGWAFRLVVAVIAISVLYPVSWGPALWLQASGNWPVSMIWADHIYDPLRWLLGVAPAEVQDLCSSYLVWWASRAGMPQL